MGNALAVHNVELRLPEGGRHLILHNFCPGAVAHHLAAVFQGFDAADVDPDGSIELQGPSAGGDLRVAVHDAHLFAELVDEDDDGIGLAHGAGELPESLAHQPGMKAHIAVAHLALDLRPGHQGGNGVHHDDIDGAGTHQSLRNFQGLLTGVRLGDQHFINIYTQSTGIGGVQGVLGVHKGHLAPLFLGLCRHMEGQGGLTGGFRPVDFHDTAPGQAAHPQRHVQRQGAGGDHVHL